MKSIDKGERILMVFCYMFAIFMGYYAKETLFIRYEYLEQSLFPILIRQFLLFGSLQVLITLLYGLFSNISQMKKTFLNANLIAQICFSFLFLLQLYKNSMSIPITLSLGLVIIALTLIPSCVLWKVILWIVHLNHPTFEKANEN